jgi:arsenate reductase
MIKILILCTSNSSRSQMAEAFLKSFDPRLFVCSAGVKPASHVHPLTVRVMSEIGIDIGASIPKNVIRFLSDSFDYVITVCDDARENCPVFTGKVGRRIHIGFEDPADAKGSEQEILKVFLRIRDQIHDKMLEFYKKELAPG